MKPGDADHGGVDGDLGVLARVESVAAAGAGVEARLVANLQRADSGWLYDSMPLRFGAPLTLRTSGYEVTGTVTGIAPRQ
jgi:hypothetical protein